MWSFGTKVVPICTVCLFEGCELVYFNMVCMMGLFSSLLAFAVKPVFDFQTKMPKSL